MPRRGMRPAPLILSLILFMVSAAGAQSREQIARGKYIFGAAAGCGCHTAPKQALNAGASTTGPSARCIRPISRWIPPPASASGRTSRSSRPPGRGAGRTATVSFPCILYRVQRHAGQDLKDLVVYLRSVPPVNRATPAKKITVPMFESVFLPAWLATFAARRYGVAVTASYLSAAGAGGEAGGSGGEEGLLSAAPHL